MSTTFLPVQDRSKETFGRMLAVAEALVAERGFEQVSVREICGRAGLTTGAFYARFAKKEDLALHLMDRVIVELESISRSFRTDIDRLGLEPAIRGLFRAVIDLYQAERGVLTGLVGMIRSNPSIGRRLRQANDRFAVELWRGIERRLGEIAHPDPPVAVRLGLLCTLNALREVVLNQHLFERAYSYSNDTLVDELTRMFLGYIGADQ